jgi:stalled ribosome rescue protein Dom34
MANHPRHVAVWLDQREAHIFEIARDSAGEVKVHTEPRRVGPHDVQVHPADAKHYFHHLATALAGAEEILIVGPSTAKLHFLKWAHADAPEIAKRIVGVETVDHPTDGQLAAFARQYFGRVDRMKGLVP